MCMYMHICVYIYIYIYMTVCRNPLAHALLKFGLPGNLPGIFRKSSGNTVFLLLRCWDICWRAGAASFFQPPRMCTNPLSHAIVAIATRNKSGRAHA